MKQSHIFVLIVLLWTTITPSYAALPAIERLNKLKKSLTTHADHFIKCIKGHKECSPQEKIIVQTTLSLLIALGLVIIGKGAYVLKKYMEPTPPTPTIKQPPLIIPNINEQLLNAASENNLSKLQQLVVNDNANVNFQSLNGPTALHWAINHNNIPMAEFLITHGAQVNYVPLYNVNPPLHYASHQGNIDMIKTLIKHGAKVNFIAYGYSPIDIAIDAQNKDVVTLLANNDLTIYFPDDSGYKLTYLHKAAKKGNVDIAKIFIEKELNINARDKDGATPLFYGVLSGNIDMVQLLLDFGADPTIHEKLVGFIAADMTQDVEIKKLLQQTQKRSPVGRY